MVGEDKAELRGLLEILPPVEFCCIYGSKLHPNNKDETSMTDHIIGVADPRQWHSENLNLNKDHYASWLVHLGGARMINDIANDIGVGVHFNPFVSCNKKMVKYGVVRMHDFIQDILRWDRFYLSGRLQKPVNILVDKLDIKNVNTVNLKAATSAALLLLPSKFTEEDLYAKICSLSYMGDLRMLFAEDKNKVKKIVRGQFYLFEEMYKPFLEEYEANNLLRFSSAGDKQVNIFQDCGLSAASTLVSSLPSSIRSDMAMKLGDKRIVDDSGRVRQVVIGSKEQAAECMKRLVRRRVMFSSTRQAAAGLLTAGAVHGVRYVANKMCKAWKSRV
ncbi:putative haloacid dehalogenase-like hydrolase domain-containing protein 3-like [Capsicum annuum]|uniref:phosphatidate cytidylyltransferase, mitochondrial isoform X1 n=2 Tax=Capsicum annuum TaxID=4072 RepID=UPI001FB19B56|nr:phosphatidate cytidylyltransferase, mitochondrial isoform X1 [Capsicum annuum]XP_016560274.2 phosphatidate cytidylyltransferase, mitochondrial isoform X1 [Capsicum annuum]KAF3623428.1 putative haloacid dehalogenase-like hydrolase domain-containing protein 3-like [Capsicum annuum]